MFFPCGVWLWKPAAQAGDALRHTPRDATSSGEYGRRFPSKATDVARELYVSRAFGEVEAFRDELYERSSRHALDRAIDTRAPLAGAPGEVSRPLVRDVAALRAAAGLPDPAR